MTPESAHSGGRIIDSPKQLFKALIWAVVIFMVALLFSSAKVIGMGIKMTIEAADEAALGVQITIKSCALNLLKGYVKIVNLKVHNPLYKREYKKDDNGKVTFEYVRGNFERKWTLIGQ